MACLLYTSFLAEKIGFMNIPQIIETVLSSAKIEQVESIHQLEIIDEQARKDAKLRVSALC